MTAGAAAGPGVTREHGLGLLRDMLRIRAFEDRCAELYSAGRIRGFLHLYNGQEAIAVGVMRSLRPADAIVGTYREHGHAIARGISMQRLMAELCGKETGCSRGRGGSMHVFDAASRFYGGNAIVGGNLPLALGLALAEQMQDREGIAACFFGEGAVAEGEFHESMNLAALWSLPVLFVCENNLYAMGTSLARSHSRTGLAARLCGYAMRAMEVDGMDVLAVESTARELAGFVRTTRAPAFLEAHTYRLRAHSMYDPQLYRSKAEVKEWEDRGPLITLTRHLKSHGLMSEEDFISLQGAADAEVDEAVQFAERSAFESTATLQRYTYAETPDGRE